LVVDSEVMISWICFLVNELDVVRLCLHCVAMPTREKNLTVCDCTHNHDQMTEPPALAAASRPTHRLQSFARERRFTNRRKSGRQTQVETSASSTFGATRMASPTYSRLRQPRRDHALRRASIAPSKAGNASANISAPSLLWRSIRWRCANRRSPLRPCRPRRRLPSSLSPPLVQRGHRSFGGGHALRMPAPKFVAKRQHAGPQRLGQHQYVTRLRYFQRGGHFGIDQAGDGKAELISSSLTLCPPDERDARLLKKSPSRRQATGT